MKLEILGVIAFIIATGIVFECGWLCVGTVMAGISCAMAAYVITYL